MQLNVLLPVQLEGGNQVVYGLQIGFNRQPTSHPQSEEQSLLVVKVDEQQLTAPLYPGDLCACWQPAKIHERDVKNALGVKDTHRVDPLALDLRAEGATHLFNFG